VIPQTKPLLSRVAESVYWMARYIERAENVARFVGVNIHLQLDLPLDPAEQWQSLVDTSGDAAVFSQRYGEASQSKVIEFLAFDGENPNSIASCVRAARENARSVRETISTEMWEQVNSMYLLVQSHTNGPDVDDPAEFFRSIRMAGHLFQGITDATMSHGEAWHFLRMGRRLERADKTSRILDVKYFMLLPSVSDMGTPYDDIHWSAVLKSVSGFQMYRQKYGRIAPRQVAEFLITDSEFPRAIRYCIDSADQSLHEITGVPAGSFRCRSEQMLGMLHAEVDFTSVDTVLASGLHEYLDRMQDRLNEIDSAILEDFFLTEPAGKAAGV
jgi:uncharacterized alpha-E superfamily protein